eukprot:SAG22_NODE_598_length_8708_cov_2.090487_8_plen_131_part_00
MYTRLPNFDIAARTLHGERIVRYIHGAFPHRSPEFTQHACCCYVRCDSLAPVRPHGPCGASAHPLPHVWRQVLGLLSHRCLELSQCVWRENEMQSAYAMFNRLETQPGRKSLGAGQSLTFPAMWSNTIRA